MSGPRRLSVPRPVAVRSDAQGQPATVGGDHVQSVREAWLVEDAWWTPRPIRRRYWEVVTTSGRDLVVFRDLREGGWFLQR